MSGKCPKCDGTEIVNAGHDAPGRVIGVGWLGINAVAVDRWFCTSYGYSEDWVNDPAKLPVVRENYKNG